MKTKIILPIIFFGVLVVLWWNRYDVVSAIKYNLRDQLKIEISEADTLDLTLLVIAEEDTVYSEKLSETKTVKLKRFYGKNNFYLKVNDSLISLKLSYYKEDVWKSSKLYLSINDSYSTPKLFWKREYNGKEEEGELELLGK